MTFLLPKSRNPEAIPARGANTPLPTYWQGIGAASEATDLEVDRLRLRADERDVRQELGRKLAERVGLDAIIAWEEQHGRGYDRMRPKPTTLDEAYWDMGIQFGTTVYDIARQQAAQNPEAWKGVDLTDEGIKAETDRRRAIEYQNAQDMMALAPSARGQQLMGGLIQGVTDPVNVALSAFGGAGAGRTFLSVVGREAMLNMGIEAATLPGQFEIADRLGIEDPDVVQALTFAAASGAILGGLFEAGARGVYYYRQTRRPVGPDPALTEALVTRAEEAISASPSPMEPVLRDIAREAPSAPVRASEGLEPLVLSGETRVPAAPEIAAAPARDVASVARRFGLTEREVADVLDTPLADLRARDDVMVPSNTDEPSPPVGLAEGSAKIQSFGNPRDAYVEVLRRFDPHKLNPTEAEDNIRLHPTFDRYVQWAREGKEPPPVFVAESEKTPGVLLTTNRRRTLAAREAGSASIPGWFSPTNKETGLPLKYGDILDAVASPPPEGRAPSSPAPKLTKAAAAADTPAFDLGARSQMDFLDEPGGKKAQPIRDQRSADLRDTEGTVVYEGREMSVGAALDDLDRGDDFADVLDLCGKKPEPKP